MRALICGIGGQDGSYLARFLLQKGYEVWGTSRDAEMTGFSNLKSLKIDEQLHVLSMASNDFRSVFSAVELSDPDQIYYLSGQSSVELSFEQPSETLKSNLLGVLNVLEVIRMRGKPIRFFNAGSGECFGDTGDRPADEHTVFCPRSPYAIAKASAHSLVANYRVEYGIFCCTGIMFDHESPLRPAHSITRKIVASAARMASGSPERLNLGRLDIYRDWGWAPEYVDAMWRMLSVDVAEDLVIATGHTAPLEAFVAAAFDFHGLDWTRHVNISDEFARPSDLLMSRADPGRALTHLGWTATIHMEEVVRRMSVAESVHQEYW